MAPAQGGDSPALRHADAGEVPPPAGATRGDLNNQSLFLDVVLNRVPLWRLGYFVMVQGRLHATPQTLRELGLTWPGEDDDATGLVALDGLAGVHYRYDVPEQRVHLDVPVSMLTTPPVAIGYRTPPPPRLDPDTRAPGLLLNYSLWAQGDGRRHSASSWQELRLFGVGPGVWRSSSVVSTHRGDGHGDATRLDTSWQLDFPEPMLTVVVGDTYSQGLDWTRSLRFGGVRVSRNFGLQPYRVTVPLASFAGEAALPSTVELFIDGIRQARQEVAPGRFQIDSAPVLSGRGNAQVVVTDITGQSQVVDFTVYNSRHLLQRGLADWSLEAGSLRRDYGLRSFSYDGDAMASGSLRYGVSDFLTVEAHAEGTRGLEMGGAGAMLRLGRAGGIVNASLAHSRHDAAGDGNQYSLGYEWRNRRFSLSAATQRRDGEFRDIASRDSGRLAPRSDRAFVGLNLGRRGSLGAGYVRQDLADSRPSRYATLSWSQRLHDRAHLGLSLSHDLTGDTGTAAFLHLSMSLGRHRQAWASVQHRDAGSGLSVGAMQSTPLDAGGWGWRAQADAGGGTGGQAEVSRATTFGRWDAGVRVLNGSHSSSTTGYFRAGGGVLWMQGGLFPMRQVFDAFALVSTDGIAGVPVMRENRPVGVTDARGLLLVPSLNAWQNNRLSIDPLVLPADVSVERIRMEAVPGTGSGMLARFPMRGIVAVTMLLRDADGQPLPAGSPAELVAPDGAVTPVNSIGYGGQAWLQSPPGGARLRVRLEDRQCTANVPDTLPQRGWVELGEVPCR